MTRMRVELPVVIALGSNLPGDHGDREQLLRLAVQAIDALSGVRVTAASGIVETPALKLDGVDENAPSYLNAVVLARAALSPEMLLGALHGIEAALGRVRQEVWGDRTIDLDLIDFGGLRRATEEITLPHPRAWQRAFVLAPWRQVQPDAVLPKADGTGSARVADLLLAAQGRAPEERVTPFPAEPLFTASGTGGVSADPATVS